jgi:RNA polymerase sigma-70 factor (ECF subfamily)
MSGWERLVREHGPMVLRTAWRLLRDVQEAEDVAQEVLLELFATRRAEDVQPGLLQCAAVRRSIDRLRQRPPGVSGKGLPPPARDDGPDAGLLEAELAERLRAGVATLPPRQAEVFCLRFLHEASYEQIAAAVGISPQAVAVHLHQARVRLRAFLGELAEETKR